jgi:hypothetical protein
MSQPKPASPAALTVKRIQYRVGHGGFHAAIIRPTSLGAFRPLAYVFDVGAGPDVVWLEAAIDRFIGTAQNEAVARIDFIFISHIDEDHVSRLSYLIAALKQAGISIGTLVLPWLNDASKLLNLSSVQRRNTAIAAVNLLGSSSTITQFAADLGFADVMFVRNADSADDHSDQPAVIRAGVTLGGAIVPASIVRSGTNISQTGQPWDLIVTQLVPPEPVLNAFLSEVRRLTKLDPSREIDRINIVSSRRHRSSMRTAMRTAIRTTGVSFTLPRPHVTLTNWSSLSLYSGTRTPFRRHIVPRAQPDFEMNCEHAWVHTGDLPLHVPAVWNDFDAAWNASIGKRRRACVVTAPHHGSIHGHNSFLYQRFKPAAVLFNLGRSSGSTRGRPKWAKLIDPKPAMKAVRGLGSIKIRLLSN